MEKQSDVRSALRAGSIFHYRMLDMDTVLKPYIGSPDAFFSFLTQEWGWIVSTEENDTVIYADENKDTCVCPMKEEYLRSGLAENLCFCSEGFAERMFSKVLQEPVRAEVVRSVLRGGSSCVYRIERTGSTTG